MFKFDNLLKCSHKVAHLLHVLSHFGSLKFYIPGSSYSLVLIIVLLVYDINIRYVL